MHCGVWLHGPPLLSGSGFNSAAQQCFDCTSRGVHQAFPHALTRQTNPGVQLDQSQTPCARVLEGKRLWRGVHEHFFLIRTLYRGVVSSEHKMRSENTEQPDDGASSQISINLHWAFIFSRRSAEMGGWDLHATHGGGKRDEERDEERTTVAAEGPWFPNVVSFRIHQPTLYQ